MNLTMPELPDFPQLKFLPDIAARLWQSDQVKALWLGGSFAAGNQDSHSDVDLRVAVSAETFDYWRDIDLTEFFGEEYLEGQVHDFTGNGYLHHFLGASGTLWDVWFLDPAIYIPEGHVLLIGCRDDELRRKLDEVRPTAAFNPPAAKPEELRRVLVDYWITAHKHVKVIDRGKILTLYAGFEAEMRYLLRLWYALASGCDMGTSRFTIHMMAAMQTPIKATFGDAPERILGAPLRTVEEIKDAIEMRHREVARVGRLVAEQLGFAYPEVLETVVRRVWREAMRAN